MSEQGKILCGKCDIELTMQKTEFTYMGFAFNNDMLKCPACGLVYIPEETVRTRMLEVEMQLEEK